MLQEYLQEAVFNTSLVLHKQIMCDVNTFYMGVKLGCSPCSVRVIVKWALIGMFVTKSKEVIKMASTVL